MKILVANLGSTSLKWRLFDFSGARETLLHKGGFERVTDYPKAIEDCLDALRNENHLQHATDLAGIGFKTIMAKGINGCARLDSRVLAAMETFCGVAPAHNPPYIAGIRHFAHQLPEVPLIGLFETAFYQYAPEPAMRYAVPDAWYEAGVRRWGFHGASHKFIAERSAELLGREDVAERARELYVHGVSTPVRAPWLRVISCHLGGSSSITGILNGAGVGTSMGFSPQSGLPQNNRVGDLDSFALPFVMRKMSLSVDEAEKVLCKESGLKALSGGFNDFRDIESQAHNGNAKAQLALDVYVHQVRHWIGAMFAELNGADALVFTAGIGENRHALRAAICNNLDQLGIALDQHKNDTANGKEGEISRADSKVKVLIIPTNEELVVAREVKRFLEQEKVAALRESPESATPEKKVSPVKL